MNTFKNCLWKLVVIAVVLMMVISGISNARSVYAVNENTQQTIVNQNETAPQTSEDTTQENAKEGATGTSVSASENEKVEEKTDADQSTGLDPPAATENKTDSVEMPEASFTASTDKLTISVTALANTFPKGTKMDAKEISASDAKSIAKEKLNNIDEAVGADITFSYEGKEIEPANDKNVTVKMTLKNEMDGKNFQVLHKKDSGDIEKMTAEVSGKKAVFKAKSFSIYVITSENVDTYKFYDGNKQLMDTYTQKITSGEKLDQPNAPEKEGYKFIGWSTSENATVADFDFDNLPVVTGTTHNIYAVFKEVHYVFFMAAVEGEDATKVASTKEGIKGNTISADEISKVKLGLASNQSIEGWYYDKAFNEKVDSITIGDQNIRVYPKILTGHYIIFDSDGGTYFEPRFIKGGDIVDDNDTPKPKKNGYTFQYWATKDSKKYEYGNTLTEDLKLHAVWKANTNTKYTVIYWQENANDDKYSYHESEEKHGVTGTEIDISSINKSYDGFTQNTEKTNEANKDVTISGDGSTIINVYYTRNEYSVKFYKYEQLYWFSGDWTEMTNLRITAKYGANISDQWPTGTSKIWGTKKGNGNGAQPYQSGISTMPLNGANFYYVDRSGRYTLNLHYNLQNIDGKGYKLDHTDSFNSNNNQWHTTQEDHYDIEGFTYEDNVKDGSLFKHVGNNTYEVSFKYSRNSYKINFINGDLRTEQTFKYEAAISQVDLQNAPERPSGIPEEYTFAGWFDNELGVGDPVKLPGKMPAHNITLYAKWKAPEVSVTVHDLDEDKTQAISNLSFRSKIDINNLPTVKDSNENVIVTGNSDYTYTVPDGSHWVGWATKDDQDNYTLFNFDTELKKDLHLYPYVIDSKKYKVTYVANDGKGEVTDDKKYALNSFADVKSAEEIDPPDDKMFLNWHVYNVNDDGTSTATDTYLYPGDKLKMTGTKLLKANYVPVPQKVSLVYYANNGKDFSPLKHSENGNTEFVNNDEITLYEGSKFVAPTNSEGVKAVFDSWNTKADGSGKSFKAGQKVGINKLGTDENRENKLYAQWKYVADLTISKSVTGNQGDKTKSFEFHVVINNVKANTEYTLDTTNATDPRNPSKVTANANGEINRTIYLKDKESITFKDVNITKKDATYSVNETNGNGYTTTYKIDDKSPVSKISTSTEKFQKSHKVAFTNTLSGSVPTGIQSNTIITFPLLIAGIGFVLRMLKIRNDGE